MSATPADVEAIKARSKHLRGTLKESLRDGVTGAIAADDTHILKFHGSYQQDDRDVREGRLHSKLEPLYSFMLRTRLPGGVATAQQWLILDELARQFGDGGLRLTTRQAFQLHGVVKAELKHTMEGLHRALLDTLAACGDVNRNVMSPPHTDGPVFAATQKLAADLSQHLLPHSTAYAEVWLDDVLQTPPAPEPVPVEPIYGERYLPRKFKIAIAVPPDNDVDVFAHDLGFIAVVGDDGVVGYNVVVGGGMGVTHGDDSTHARLGDVIGFVAPADALAVAEAVVTTQRDWGNRESRRHARLKYTIERRGLDAFVAEVEARSRVRFAPVRPYVFQTNGERFGWRTGVDGRRHLTVHVMSGRLRGKALDALRHIAATCAVTFRLTPNQNLVIADVAEADVAAIDAVVEKAGLGVAGASPRKRQALACVALPTCTLAMAEAERVLPAVVGSIDGVLEKHGLKDLELHVRVTGCPNGCARPYLAEVALVGKGLGTYNLHVGGSRRGDRLNEKIADNISVDAAAAVLDDLCGRYRADAQPEEGFGDWCVRAAVASSFVQRTETGL
jgi:sulfite reductase (NADPH) hemoprotein beta-component